MTIALAFSSTSTLRGAREINDMHLAAKMEDLGGKMATLISGFNVLNTSISLIQTALVSLNGSGVSVSSLSGVTFTSTFAALSNFRT